jgi:soluble lytic murein transglycosylase
MVLIAEALAGEQADEHLRFRLLFFAARIARQRGQIDRGIDLFQQALPFAPDSGQADACIWYILDSSLSRGADVFILQLEQLIPQWHDDAYFDDVLDKLSRELVQKRDWKRIVRVFGLLRNQTGSVSKAKYAWITGRAIEEGYLSAEERQQAAQTINAAEAPVLDFIRIAYNTGNASFYYRSLSAAVLGESLLDLPAAGTGGKPSAAGRLSTAG